MKIAIITGGSRGLGRSAALHLAARGVGVLLTYRGAEDEADKTVKEIEKAGSKAAALRLDVGKSATFPDFAEQAKETLVKVFGTDRFDYLLNNAGTGLDKKITETTEQEFDDLVNVHFKGVFFLTNQLLPLLNDGGRILNVSSGLARFSYPGKAAYAAMKGAVEVLTRYQAKEWGERGIAVNTIAPGAIATDFGGGAVRDNPEVNKAIAGATALGRAGLPEDIGAAVAALFSSDLGWVNGQRIEVSGGMML